MEPARAPDDSQITLLLHRWTAGDAEALGELMPVLYEPLRQLAHQRICGEPDARSLDTTGFVHGAYLKLANHQSAILEQHYLDGLSLDDIAGDERVRQNREA